MEWFFRVHLEKGINFDFFFFFLGPIWSISMEIDIKRFS